MAKNVTPHVPTEEEDQEELALLFPVCCTFMNYTWELDPKQVQNIKNIMEEARDYLRSKAGSPAVSFQGGSNRNLFKVCVWYFLENKRAEFEQEYSSDLLNLRLMEGFGCGK